MGFVRKIWPYVLLALLVVGGVLFWQNQNQILDWVATRGYTPAPLVSQAATDTTMTPYAKELFYANRPVIETRDVFNKHCTDPSEQVAVLGCYTGNRLGIYIYDVTDPRLSGIEQVTAAHEMLHQAYQRLNRSEKMRVNGLLQEYYDLHASQALKDKIGSYKSSEPDDLQNEMHSIFGTEVSDLPPELEVYYKQYFADRQKVLALHNKYQSEFDQRIAQIKSDDARLTDLKSQIDANKKELDNREKQLLQMRAKLDSYLASNNIPAYNASVPAFNSLVLEYRNLVASTNRLVDEFNSLLTERNSLAVQERQLEDAIDSSVTTAPKQ